MDECDATGSMRKPVKLHFTFEYLVTAEPFEVHKRVVRDSNPSLQTCHCSRCVIQTCPSRKLHL